MLGQTISHYRIVEKIGSGGMGEVYRAVDERLDREVAIKLLPVGTLADQATRKRFRKEAMLLAKLNHPNIETVHDFDSENGVDFLVMELVAGKPLTEQLSVGPFSEREILRLGVQLANGLSAAHARGIIHRDLKPGNIMVGPDGHLKILDFGLAQLIHPAEGSEKTASITESPLLAGTLPYMAPESFDGAGADERSDIYACGAVLYEMATDQRPFPESYGPLLIEAILHRAVAPPRQLNARIAQKVEEIILKAMDKNPDLRYQSAAELRVDLERLLAPSDAVQLATPVDMSAVPTLEVAHVLFMDIVGYSVLPMEAQQGALRKLQKTVRATSDFSRAQGNDELIRLPTGDGMALVFFGDPEAPVRCALEVSRALRDEESLGLRMGIHTGPVYRIADINANRNVAGGGINLAQRVMDCGDAGHILVSKSVADILSQFSNWRGSLHDLGEAKVKHGLSVRIYNVFTADAGNPDVPAKLRPSGSFQRARALRWVAVGGGAALVAAATFICVHLVTAIRKPGIATTISPEVKMRPSVAVLGFKNLSGKQDVAWVSPALTQMLGTDISTGEGIRVIPNETVAHTKIDLALNDEEPLGRSTLSRVRNNIGSDFVLLGSFLDMNGQVRVDLSLQDARSGETVSTISETGPEQQLPDIANRAGEQLRHELGAGDPSPVDTASAKASQSSNSEATRLYSEGLEKLQSFDAQGAKNLLEQAIADDPNYALAHAALAEAWRSLGYDGKAADEAKKAVDLSENLSRENRLAIEAQYRDSLHDSTHEAEIYKSLFTFYPDNLEYGLSLAKSQFFGSQWQEANSTLDALQQLKSPDGDDPRIDFYRATVAFATGDYRKAETLAERVELRARQTGARRMIAQAQKLQCEVLLRTGNASKAAVACDGAKSLFSEVGDYKSEADVWGDIAFQTRDRQANDRQIDLLRRIQSDGGLAYAMTVAGELSADSGDLSRALQEYERALVFYQKVGSQDGVISAYGNLGWVYSLQGNLVMALRNDQQAIDLIRHSGSKEQLDIWLDDFANDLLASGDLQGASAQLDQGFAVNQETSDKRAESFLHATRSELLLAEGNIDEARREVGLAIKNCEELNDRDGVEDKRLILAKLDVADSQPKVAIETLHEASSYFGSRKVEDSEVEVRTVLLEALLTEPLAESRQEMLSLASTRPETQNMSLKLAANIQIARAKIVLGDEDQGKALLSEVISDCQKSGYQPLLLEARLAKAEIDFRKAPTAVTRAQVEQLAGAADLKGYKLIADKARSITK